MRAILLAAGRGSRLKAMTEDRPKCLVPFKGRPLLDWQLLALRSAGVERMAVVRGYRAESIQRPGLVSFDNPRWSETNMVGSLLAASSWLKEEPCLVSYTDILYGSKIPRRLMAADAPLAITYDPNWLSLWKLRFADPLSDAETFRLDSTDRLLEIGRKPRSVEEVEGQYMGLLRFTPESFGWVESHLASLPPAAVDKLDMTSLLAALLEKKRPIRAVRIEEPWFEVDSESDLRLYESLLEDRPIE